MLCLTRKPLETIHIGDDIVVTFVRHKGSGKIQVGIDAPKDMVIVRGELIDREASSAERPACCNYL